jgi:hypothetical protein
MAINLEDYIKMKPCINLDYDESKYPSLRIKEHQYIDGVRYWERKESPICVQFCKLNNSRINAIFDCYQPGFKDCYQPEDINNENI